MSGGPSQDAARRSQRLVGSERARLDPFVVATGVHWRRRQFSWINEWEEMTTHDGRVEGMSMQADVDVHSQDGAVLPATPPTEPLFSSDLYRQQLAEADARIGKIIHANSAAQTAATVKP